MLTGEAPAKIPMSYLTSAVELLTRYFSSVALEMFPMGEDDYRTLKESNPVSGLKSWTIRSGPVMQLADVALVADANQVCSGIIRALKQRIRD